MVDILIYWNMFCDFFAWYIFLPCLAVWSVYMIVMCARPQ